MVKRRDGGKARVERGSAERDDSGAAEPIHPRSAAGQPGERAAEQHDEQRTTVHPPLSTDEETLADTRTLRAMAHPLRAALLDAIRTYGPLTATEAAAQVDDTPSNCSFHLRTLAAAGLIEQAPSDDGRRKPWRAVRLRLVLEPGTTVESRSAFQVAADLLHRRAQQGLSEWSERRAEAPQEWQDASFSSLLNLRLSAAELAAVQAAVNTVLAPYVQEQVARDADPSGHFVPVRMSFFAYPILSPPQPALDESAAEISPIPGE